MWRWEAGPPVVEADMMWWATAMGPEVIGSGGGLGLQQLGARTRVSLWIQHHPRVGSLHHIRRPLRGPGADVSVSHGLEIMQQISFPLTRKSMWTYYYTAVCLPNVPS